MNKRFGALLTLSSSIRAWCALSAAGAAVLAWEARYAMNPDGVAYLDMASNTLRHGPASLVNGWWGPLYPALIAVFLLLFRPSASGEFLVVHLLNWLVFVGATASFGFFLKYWHMQEADHSLDLEPERKQVLVPFGFCLFFWSMGDLIGLANVTPDLLLAGMVFLSAGIGCRVLRSSANPRMAVAFGLSLALCYFAKPNGFAVALFAVATLALLSWFRRIPSSRLGIATFVFVVLSAPFIALMTNHVGRLSIGETGTGNYLIWVNRIGSGQEIDAAMAKLIRSGTLVHPPRVLLEKPLTLEFASPVDGVYPWHDEFSYWIAGARPHFSLREQINAVIANFQPIQSLLVRLSAVWGGVFSLWLLSLAKGQKLRRLSTNEYWLLSWSLCVCGTFTLVHLESRYIAPFIVLLCLVSAGAVMGNIERVAEGAVLLAASLTILLPVTVGVAQSGGHIFRNAIVSRSAEGLLIADAIRSAGVNPGDYVAVIGRGYTAVNYARLAGVRIVVEIPDENAFWSLSKSERIEVRHRLADVHVKALLTASVIQRSDDPAWSEVKGLESSHFSISRLPKAP